MSEYPTPVVICSSLTEKGAETTMQALAAGAVKAAAKANVRHMLSPQAMNVAPKLNADAILPAASGHAMAHTTERIIAIGTSTGGTQALEEVLTTLTRHRHRPAHAGKVYRSLCQSTRQHLQN